MTKRKDLKRRVRARQKRTGEKYVEARRQELARLPESAKLIEEAKLTTCCLWACRCVERVLPLYEASYPGEESLRRALGVMLRFLQGKETREELEEAHETLQGNPNDGYDPVLDGHFSEGCASLVVRAAQEAATATLLTAQLLAKEKIVFDGPEAQVRICAGSAASHALSAVGDEAAEREKKSGEGSKPFPEVYSDMGKASSKAVREERRWQAGQLAKLHRKAPQASPLLSGNAD
jgi:hypothetical protein